MRYGTALVALAMVASGAGAVATPAAAQPAKDWVDPLTGHRVVRVSTEPGSVNLYFHQNSYLPQGDAMVFPTPSGIAIADLKTWKVRTLVARKDAVLLFTGRRTRNVYFASRGREDAGKPFDVFAADADTGRIRKVATVVVPLKPDGTLDRKAGETNTPGMNDYRANWPDGRPMTYADAKEVHMNRRLDAGVPMEIFTIDTRTGARRVVTASKDWLNHIQFSPTDPMQILYCHEGPWHRVDRIWTIRADGTGKTLVHKRTMNMEIAGHEFWSSDGRTIWYDLQTPRGQVFWVAGYELGTGKRHWYNLDRNQWSVHFNQTPDGKRFSGDGGDAEMVAKGPDAKYLYLFTPKAIPDVAGIHADNADALIVPGTFESEKLVDMRRQDYRMEPNMTFTPNGKWSVFRGNFEGAPHVYAVEVAKAK